MNPVRPRSSRHDTGRVREQEVFGDSHEKTVGKGARSYSRCLRGLCTNTQGIGNKQSQLGIATPGVNMMLSLKPGGWDSRLTPSNEIELCPPQKKHAYQVGEGIYACCRGTR